MTKSPFIFGAVAAIALLIAGCPPSRFASCKTDADCGDRGGDAGKLVCYNLRCVECHYDGDCGDGKHCGSNNVCESLDTRTPEANGLPPAKTLGECAKRCKGNPACGESCHDQFENARK